MINEIKSFVGKVLGLSEEEEPEDFAEKLIRKIHEENIKKKKEAEELMESWKDNPKLIK